MITAVVGAADGTTKTITSPGPTVTAPGANPYPNPGVWTIGGAITDNYAHPTDLVACFEPAWTKPVSAFTHPDGSGLTAVDTPYGPGMQIVCTDTCVTPWDSTCKAILAQGPLAGNDKEGTVAQWTFPLKLPAQTISKIGSTAAGWFAGTLFELHNQGPLRTWQQTTLSVDVSTQTPRPGTPMWRVSLRNSQTGVSELYGSGPNAIATFDAWHRFDLQVYWTQKTSGFMHWYVDGQPLVNWSGPTWYAGDGLPVLQYGWYAGLGGVKNTSVWGPVIRRQFAALGS